MNKLLQKILCIRSDILFRNGKWNGLKTDNLEEYYKLLVNESEFCVREQLENDPSYKQIIPQVILRNKNKYFLHRQINVTEKRLNSLCPLPLGGHVEEFDLNKSQDLIQTALERELMEEAEIKSKIVKKEFKGLIYLEDENPVNHVHIGLIYIFDLDGRDVSIKEDGLENIGFVGISYLRKHKAELTFWSRIIIEKL